jgi:hypothetical protein
VPFDDSRNDYGHIRAVQWIKQWLLAHESRSTYQAMTTGTLEPFFESRNDYGHMGAVQCIKQWLRGHDIRSINQAITTGTWEPINESSNHYGHIRAVKESSNDYGHMGAVQWFKWWIRAHESRSMNKAVSKEKKEPFNDSISDYGNMRKFNK